MASPLRRPWIPLLLIALLAGCASTQRGQAEKTERQLIAAGFQMRLADTPSKLAQLEALPQRKLTPHDHEGRPFFLYPMRSSASASTRGRSSPTAATSALPC